MNRFRDSGPNLQSKYRVNEEIKADTVMVIGGKGENLGVIPKYQALTMAREEGLDLVQVGERDSVVIVKMMDFSKFAYEKKKQLSESKKHQKIVQIKEIKIRPGIGDQDYRTKLNKAEDFFKRGKKVKFTVQFKGREIAKMDEFGDKLFKRIVQDLTAKNIGLIVEEKENKGGVVWFKIYSVKEK